MVELALAAAVGYAIYYFTRATHFVNGAERFTDDKRREIADKLNSTSPLPSVTPAFADASSFRIVKMNPASVSTTFAIETAASAGFPVAVSMNVLDVLASPTEEAAFIITMKRGQETKICAPGTGFALIKD